MLYWFSLLQCKLLQLHLSMTLLYSYSHQDYKMGGVLQKEEDYTQIRSW